MNRSVSIKRVFVWLFVLLLEKEGNVTEVEESNWFDDSACNKE
jgi:hypothetical protein